MTFLKHHDLFVRNTLTEKQAYASDDHEKKWYIVNLTPCSVTLSNSKTYEQQYMSATQFNHRQQFNYKTPAELIYDRKSITEQQTRDAQQLGYLASDGITVKKCPHCQNSNVQQHKNTICCGNCGSVLTKQHASELVETLARMHII